MKAVVWAGGLGTRLKPLTNERQKCMLDVGGKPCLSRIIDHLIEFGVTQIIVKVHHKSEEVMNCFGSQVLYHYQKELKEEEESLEELKPFLKDDFCIVVNGDTISDVDLSKMMNLAQNFYGKPKNVKFMAKLKSKDVYAGTMILCPSYWTGDKSFVYSYLPNYWFDIGTFNGLLKAREFFNKQ